MKKTLKICRCPKCKNLCEKISGCNFMYCRCKTNFCFLCDVELIEAYHSSHFQKNDPYNSPCRVWYNGTWVDPDKVPKIIAETKQQIEQVDQIVEKENKIPCPNCQSKQKMICQLLYFDKIIQCSSVKCQQKAFCISCKKQVNLNDPMSHFNVQSNQCKFI
ncbi:unnamed protein product [Paramecium sonneborni]|nr:unnamed protein product [Paramecium sonneborni]